MKWFPLKRRLLPPSRSSNSQLADLPVKFGDKYDEASGQVYRETYVSIPSGNDQDWARKRHVVREQHEKDHLGYEPAYGAENPKTRASKGGRSLQDIAMDTVLDNIANITLEYLESLPSVLVDRIWSEVNQSTRMSFDVWKTFSKLLQNRDETTLRTLRYREAIESPRSPLEIYTSPLASISFEFITILSITTAFNLRDLVKLSEIPNIGVLEIVRTSGTVQCIVSDRVVRAWSLAAVNDGAFKVLRILRLWNQLDVTGQSLSYLKEFPALGVYDVRGCGFNLRSPTDARLLGWKPTVDHSVLNVLHAACVERAIILRENLGLYPQPIRRASAKQLWDGAKVWKLPRGEVAAFLTRDETSSPGTPRVAEYRLDLNRLSAAADRVARINPGIQGNFQAYFWETMDDYTFEASRMKMTWEFQLYSAYARLGELRNDRDLLRAGIDIGDQAMVGKELINSVPVVSIRLGPTSPELRPTSAGNGSHKSTYGSAMASNNSYSSNRIASHSDFHPKNLCFIRVEVPLEVQESAATTLGQGKKTKESGRKRNSFMSLAESKRMKLSDVLESFL